MVTTNRPQQTMEYDKFKMRSDNRAEIKQHHVDKLIHSISTKNLLEFKPIYVNKDFEILDGQNRFLAAKHLKVPIWYVIDDKAEAADIILLNVSKSWTLPDYLNFYVKNKNPEYVKFANHLQENQLSFPIGYRLYVGASWQAREVFTKGKMVFQIAENKEFFDLCNESIFYINKINGFRAYTKSSKLWAAMIQLFKHADFDPHTWKINLEKQVSKIGPRISQRDFLELFLEIYNWKVREKIEITREK